MEVDTFYLFQVANSIYAKLQTDDPGIDVSMPFVSSDQAPVFTVTIRSIHNPEAKLLMRENGYRRFTQLPNLLRESPSSLLTKLQFYITSLSEIDVSLYRDYAKFLQTTLFQGGQFLGQTIANLLAEFIQAYFNISPDLQKFSATLKLEYPVRICVYSAEHNVALLYDFSTKRMVLSGFKEGILHIAELVSKWPLPILQTVVQEQILTEKFIPSKLILNTNTVFLTEESESNESSEEIIDKVIQILLVTDTLDVLQDVVIEETERSILFMFNPIISVEEVALVLNAIKEKYNQAFVAAVPQGIESPLEKSNWWIIEIGFVDKLRDEIKTIYRAPEEVEEKPEMVSGKAVPVSDLSSLIDVGNSLVNIGKE